MKKVDLTPFKRAIGTYIRLRRNDLGLNQEEAAKRSGMSTPPVSEIETAATDYKFDSLLKLMSGLNIGMQLVAHDSGAGVTVDEAAAPAKWLQCTDGVQLYVLHTRHPMFLAQVVQTIPHTVRLVHVWGKMPPSKVLQAPVMKELRAYVKRMMAAAQSGN